MSEHDALHAAMHAEEPEEAEEPDTPGPSDDEAAEAEEAEEQVSDPGVEQAEQPQASGLSEADWEKRNKKAEQAFNRYAKALTTIYEEDMAQLMRCPLCLGPTPGHVVIAGAGRVDEEQADLVKHYLGLARPVDLRPDPETQTCATCDGEGKTLTGSKVPTQRERTCPTCKGYGYTPPPSSFQNGSVAVTPGEPVGGSATPDIEQEERDEWGEPLTLPDGRENPNYGRMPHRKILVQPWGTTAGLSAQDAVRS